MITHWRTRTGERVPIRELEDSHLLLIERFLLGRGEDKLNHRWKAQNEEGWRERYDAIRSEIDRRGLILLSEDGPERRSDSESFDHEQRIPWLK